MASGYDGAIRIDTRIDEKGFNKGVGRIGAALKGIMAKIGMGLMVFSLVAVGIAVAIASIASAIIAAGVAAFKVLEKITMDMYKALSPASAYYDKVTTLKLAFDSLNGSVQAMFSSLLTAASPILMKIIDWLIRIINLVSMILAALAGQKTYMKYVSGAAQQTARGTGQAAKNTDKMAKAAKGALAAFDEINVLQMEQPQEDTGGGVGGGNIMFEETAIENSILATVDKIKAWFGAAWKWVSNAATVAWEWIKTAFANGAAWLATNVVGPIYEWFGGAWQWLKQAASDAWDFVINVVFPRAIGFITGFYNWVTSIWQAIHDWIVARFKEAFEKTMVNIANFVLFINNFRDTITRIWQAIHDWIVKMFKDAWDRTVAIWTGVGAWFTTNVTDPIKNAFRIALEWIRDNWETTWGDVKGFAKTAINAIIGFINGMIRALASGINTIIDGINKIKIKIPNLKIFGDLAGMEWGFNIPNVRAPQIPLLASGAVIPPNAEFAAILGDQRNGRNLEAPESLIRQIIREELEGTGGDQNISVPVYLDSEKIYEGQVRLQRRRGTSLLTSGGLA